jgi:hypothetical protein
MFGLAGLRNHSLLATVFIDNGDDVYDDDVVVVFVVIFNR